MVCAEWPRILDVICPVCGFNYTRIQNQKLIDGNDDYQAWAGRGDVAKLLFVGECGAEWHMCFGFHKGTTYAYAEVLRSCKDSGDDDKPRAPVVRVYFIEAIGLGKIKIGRTKGDVMERLRALSTGSPCKLRLLGHIDGDHSTELTLHQQFSHIRMDREWFHGTQELLDFIARNALPPSGTQGGEVG
jgi:hypothetical protein